MIEPNTVQTQQSMAFPPLAGFEGGAQALMSTTKTAEQSIAVMLGNPTSAANKGSADLGAVTGMIQAFTELVGKLVDLISSFAKMKGDTSDASKSSTPAGQSQSSSNPSTTANAASGGASSATAGSAAGSAGSTGSSGSGAEAAGVAGACVCPPNANTTPAASAQTTTPAAPTAPPAMTAGRKAPDAGRLLGSTGQFLWKPVSEKDGKLAVLLPPNLTGKVKDVMVISPDKKTILQKGRYAGVGNGDRDHYRFLRAGGEFPDGAVVLIRLKNGESRHVVIKETSARATR